MLVRLGDSETMQGHEEQGCEVLPHSPRSQLGLQGKGRAGVGGVDRHCKVLLRSRILRVTSCTLEQGLGKGTGVWPGALWTEGWGGDL